MVIDDFMSRYEREYDYYQEVARLCWQFCETGLAQEGIRAIVTYRAKRHDRLRKKLEQRHEHKNYQDINDIYPDIPDLAGVRIALYFPSDIDEVDKFIKASFEVLQDKKFPDESHTFAKSQEYYEKRFSGYKARHYRVHLKAEDFADHQQRYTKVVVEIQVASVLMHAWAEVEHDLLYKPLNGVPSYEEYAILDQINGLVLAGEIALETLQRAVKRRVDKEGYRFGNQYDLAAYLYEHLQTKVKDSTMAMGRIDRLLSFLQLIQVDHPEKLEPFIGDLDPSDQNRTVADQLVDRMVATNPDWYEAYAQARREVDARRPPHFSQGFNEALGQFLSRWRTLERIVRLVSEALDIKMPILSNTAAMKKLGILIENEKALRDLDQLRRLRNEVVHGVATPEIDTLYQAGEQLEYLLSRLGEDSSGNVRQIINSSEEIQRLLKKDNHE